MELDENTGITIPVRNLIAMIAFTAVSTMAYFGIQERLNSLEHAIDKIQSDIDRNSEFRIKWPRGELGSLPDDARQDMLISYVVERQDKDSENYDELLDSITNVRLRLGALEKGVEVQ